MDDRPQLFRENLRRRPSLRDLVGPLLALLGGCALLALIVRFIVWLNVEPGDAWQ